jgi:hypothetical protein
MVANTARIQSNNPSCCVGLAALDSRLTLVGSELNTDPEEHTLLRSLNSLVIHANANLIFHQVKLNSVALVRKRTIPTERPTAACRRSQCQLLRIESVAWLEQRIPKAVNLDFLDPEPLLFHSSSSSVIFNEAEWTRSRRTTSQVKLSLCSTNEALRHEGEWVWMYRSTFS